MLNKIDVALCKQKQKRKIGGPTLEYPSLLEFVISKIPPVAAVSTSTVPRFRKCSASKILLNRLSFGNFGSLTQTPEKL